MHIQYTGQDHVRVLTTTDLGVEGDEQTYVWDAAGKHVVDVPNEIAERVLQEPYMRELGSDEVQALEEPGGESDEQGDSADEEAEEPVDESQSTRRSRRAASQASEGDTDTPSIG